MHPIPAMCIFYCGEKYKVVNFIPNQRLSQMMFLGFLFKLKDINLHKNSPHKLAIPAEQSKLWIPPLLLQSHVAFCKYVFYHLKIRNYVNKFSSLGLISPSAPLFLGFKT